MEDVKGKMEDVFKNTDITHPKRSLGLRVKHWKTPMMFANLIIEHQNKTKKHR